MTFYETLTAAVADVLAHGFDSQRRIDRWMEKIQAAAKRSWVPARILDKALRATFTTIYQKLVTKGRIVDMHPGVSTFTIHNVKPALRAELERRLLASANLITVYLLPESNLKLRPILEAQLKPGTRVVAHDFGIGGWTPTRTVTIPDDGEGRSHTLYIYIR